MTATLPAHPGPGGHPVFIPPTLDYSGSSACGQQYVLPSSTPSTSSYDTPGYRSAYYGGTPTAGAVQQIPLQDHSAVNSTQQSMSQFGALKAPPTILRTNSEAAISFTSYTTSSGSPSSDNDVKHETDGLAFDDDALEVLPPTFQLRSSKPQGGAVTGQSPTRRHRRTPHRLVERHYREGLNSRFDALRDAVPGPSKLKTTKAGVLAAAISHIQQLEAMNAELQNQLHVLDQSTMSFDNNVQGMPLNHQHLHRTHSQPIFCQTEPMIAGGGYGMMHSWRAQ